jgi:hypothetical protein
MSSVPGLPLSPDTGTPVDPACQYRYRWQASDGTFLFWGPNDFTVREGGSIIETDNRTVYLTWHDPDLPFSGHDVTISREILGPEGITLIGRTELTIGWDDETAVVRQAP